MSRPSPEATQHALELAYRHLGRRDRTVDEVRRHLSARDVSKPAAEAAIAELERQGYLDDARYACRFAEDRRTLDGWGVQRIEHRLRQLGIDGAHIAAAVGERDAADELRAAVELLRRRFPDPPRDDRERERALGLLARRGYDLELAHDAVRAVARARL